jgi:hypothetical protein
VYFTEPDTYSGRVNSRDPQRVNFQRPLTRAFAAGGIRTDAIILPDRHGLAGVRSSGVIEIGSDVLHVQYSAYLRGSDEPLQGLLVEEMSAVAAEEFLRLGSALGRLTSTAQDAFAVQVGMTAQDMEAAVAAHGEQVRAEAIRAASSPPVLSEEQRRFLSTALDVWHGPASWRPLPITVLGYADWTEFDADIARMRTELDQAEPQFSVVEWTRILLLSEISFASNLLGAGVEFDIVTAWRDPEALPMLRSIQRALSGRVDASLLFPGAGRPRPTR